MTRSRKVFLYTIIIGILTHAFRMTNTMICADSTNYLTSVSPEYMASVGRFILPVVEKIRGNVELPWLIGLICLALIGLSAVLFVRLFDIRDDIALVITAWILSANPVVTATFAYMYTADAYMISLLFSVLAVYLCIRRKGFGGIIFGGLCLAISLGIYQAFLSVTIVLIMLWLFKMLYTKDHSMKEIGRTTGRCFLMGIIGVGAYFVCYAIVMRIGGFGVTSYMGVDEAGSVGIMQRLLSVKDCYIDFARFFLVRWQVNKYNVMNVMMFGLTAVVWLVMVTKRKLWKNPVRVILMAVLALALPVACHIFEFISEEISYSSTTMEYSLALVYLLLIIMWNDDPMGNHSGSDVVASETAGDPGNNRWLDKTFWKKNYLQIVSMVLLVCIGFHFMVIANRAYYNMENANTKVEMLINRIVTRMEMLDGYQDNMQVVVFGSCYEIPEYVPAAPVMSGVVSNIFLTQGSEYVNFMNHYMSTQHGNVGFSGMAELAATEEFKEMEQWPSENSIKIIDGIIVIYLSDTDIEQYLGTD